MDHALTMGVFMEELVRRLTGTTLQSLFAERLRDPYDISFYLGLPEAEDDRFQEMLPAETDEQGDIVSRGDLSDDLASRPG